MNGQQTRRDVLKAGTAAMAAVVAHISTAEFAFPGQGEDEELVPFLDMPPTAPNRLDWETLDEWLTPQDQVFSVQHYGVPEFDADEFKLEISGFVEDPTTLTLEDIKRFPRTDQLMTLECAGNGSSKGFMNAVYNSRWTGTALAPILKKCGMKPGAQEVVFFGVDPSAGDLAKRYEA